MLIYFILILLIIINAIYEMPTLIKKNYKTEYMVFVFLSVASLILVILAMNDILFSLLDITAFIFEKLNIPVY